VDLLDEKSPHGEGSLGLPCGHGERMKIDYSMYQRRLLLPPLLLEGREGEGLLRGDGLGCENCFGSFLGWKVGELFSWRGRDS